MTPQAAATCPVHPEAPSRDICVRCGRFMCAACIASSPPPLCAACLPLWFDPLGVRAAPFTIGNSLKNGAKLFRPIIAKVMLVSLIFAIPGGLLSMAVAPSGDDNWRGTARDIRFANLYGALIGILGTLAVVVMLIGVAEGRTLTVGQALREAAARYFKVFVARLRAGLMILLFTVLLILPGLWQSVLLAFVIESAVRVPDQDALKYSTSLVNTKWWQVFGAVLTFYGTILLPTAALPMLLDWVTPQTPIPPVLMVIFEDWLGRVGDNLVAAFMLATFYGLHTSKHRVLAPMKWLSDDR